MFKSIVVDTFSYSPATVGLGEHALFMVHIVWFFVYLRDLGASKGILSLHNDAHQASKGLLSLHNDAHQASAGPLLPINYENDDHAGHAKMNTVFIFVLSFEHGVHFCMARVVIVFTIAGRQWARRSLVCIIVCRQ